MEHGLKQYKELLNLNFSDKDINWIEQIGIPELKKMKKILEKEEPFWKEKKFISFLYPSKEEKTRKSYNYPAFSASTECHLATLINIDTIDLDKALKKPYRLDVFGASSGFKPEMTRYFETREKREHYFEKLKARVEKGYKESWKDLDKKIAFLEKELTRCKTLRSEKMRRRGTVK